MTMAQIREFLMWCSIVNVGIIIFSFLILSLARQWVYVMHSKWFPITEGQFNAIMYSFVAFYKILIIVFNIVPYLAVCIIMD